MIRPARLAVPVLLLAMAAGCAGVMVCTDKVFDIRTPNISKEKGVVSDHAPETDAVTAEELLRYWGPPDETGFPGPDEQTWTYRFDRRWNGVILAYVVPLPLLVPVGQDFVEFRFVGDKAISATVRLDVWHGALFSFLPPLGLYYWEDGIYEEGDPFGYRPDRVVNMIR